MLSSLVFIFNFLNFSQKLGFYGKNIGDFGKKNGFLVTPWGLNTFWYDLLFHFDENKTHEVWNRIKKN